ncbi:MAG: hypothetical protein LM577_08535 [Thermoproteaceae archaeon]|nr:hypothetical protein [Thermoproteaceae archaeon]
MRPRAEVVTTLVCPRCGRRLELVEFRREICLVCWYCLRAACFGSRRFARYLDRRRRRFDWRQLLEDLRRGLE